MQFEYFVREFHEFYVDWFNSKRTVRRRRLNDPEDAITDKSRCYLFPPAQSLSGQPSGSRFRFVLPTIKQSQFFFLPELYSIGHILIWPYASYVEKSLSDQHPTHFIPTIGIKSNNIGSQQDYTVLYKEVTMAALATALKAGSPEHSFLRSDIRRSNLLRGQMFLRNLSKIASRWGGEGGKVKINTLCTPCRCKENWRCSFTYS